MCQFCGHYPCDARCPYAPEPAVVCECDNCGKEIHEGETMWDFHIGVVCEECIADHRKEAEIEEDF